MMGASGTRSRSQFGHLDPIIGSRRIEPLELLKEELCRSGSSAGEEELVRPITFCELPRATDSTPYLVGFREVTARRRLTLKRSALK